ncbi:MAG TPA: pyrroloquinoline quinone biosynthesis peptide chaperone PqqD [Rhodospirillales bacterium]|nr:pyrroloquinoline quinone biosynthesis peptide chaperone PqqD [Rhodospirillales bacterium]
MAAPAPPEGTIRPRLAPHVRLSFDARRQRWVVMAPERLLVPDDTALEVLRRCTGDASVDDIAADLAREFDAPADEIAGDVAALLRDLGDKGIVVS